MQDLGRGEAFGNLIAQTGAATNPYQFAATSGYRNDGDVGLLQVGVRYYDSTVGRFTTADPLVGNTYAPQSLNRYVYVQNNPVMLVDPTGCQAVIGAALPIAGGAAAIDGPLPIGDVIGLGILATAGGIELYRWWNRPRRTGRQARCDAAYSADTAICNRTYTGRAYQECLRRAAMRYARCLAGEAPRPPLIP